MKEVTRLSRLAYAYLCAKEYVVSRGYAREVEWQQSLSLDNAAESDFLREAAWVVMAGGMREAVVRRCFPGVTAAFCGWASAHSITDRKAACVQEALSHFNHTKKVEAIAEIAVRVDQAGFAAVKRQLRERGVDYLQSFPFVGPITSFHLAKNLGLDVVKPDRHLIRIAQALEYASPSVMCEELSSVVGDKLSVIDIVMWRHATLVADYLSLYTHFTQPE